MKHPNLLLGVAVLLSLALAAAPASAERGPGNLSKPMERPSDSRPGESPVVGIALPSPILHISFVNLYRFRLALPGTSSRVDVARVELRSLSERRRSVGARYSWLKIRHVGTRRRNAREPE